MDYKDWAALVAIPLALGAGIGTFAIKKPAACIRVMAAIKSALLLPAVATAGAWLGAWWVLRNTTQKWPVLTGIDADRFVEEVKCWNSKYAQTTVLPSIDWLIGLASTLLVCWALSESGYRLAKVVHATDQDSTQNKGRAGED